MARRCPFVVLSLALLALPATAAAGLVLRGAAP